MTASHCLESSTTPVIPWDVPHLDGLEFDPLLHRLLRERPVARVRMRFGEGSAWLVTRYHDVQRAVCDPRLSRALIVDRPITGMTPHTIAPPGGIGRTDPPDHTRLRRLVARTFGPRHVERLGHQARAVADRLLAAMVAQGPPADLTEALTGPLPQQVIGSLLGVPHRDMDRLHAWRRVILTSDHSLREGEAVKREIARYFRDLAALRAADPGDDLFSALVAAHREGALDEAELISLSVMIVLNALDQVRNLTSTMVYALLTHPGQLALLRAEPALMPRAVEELLRFIPQRNGVGLPRVATEDLVIGGRPVAAGEAVHVSYLAANRDPEVFTDPDRLDLTRDEAPHLAFGHGIHYCLGSALTRVQATVILTRLLAALPDFRLAVPPARVEWLRGTVNRGPRHLPLTW
ncbi:cytochrome P450 [Streptomyces capparidis]